MHPRACRWRSHGIDDAWPDTATFDDYVAGRCDRLGAEVVIDLRPCSERTARPLRRAIAGGPDCPLQAVRWAVTARAPELAWLWSPPEPATRSPGHAGTIVRLCARLRLPTLLVEDDDQTAAAVGLIVDRPSDQRVPSVVSA